MTADEFVIALAGLAESAQAESKEERAALRAMFTCPRREPPHKSLVHPVDDLVWRYECTSLEVGHIQFVSAPRPHWAGHMVGSWEGELLVTQEDGQVAIFEHERFGERLLMCAVDGEHFFEALTTFLGMVLQRELWLARVDEAARVCADRAGSAQCEDFYLGMLSYLEYGAVESGNA